MAYQITREDVWVGAIEDRPGELAAKLEALSQAAVNLEFLIARRAPEKPGTGVLFVAPIRGEEAVRAAEKAGLAKWASAHSLRLEGPDRPELGARIAWAVAHAGINMRGVSAAKFGDRAVFYLAFDSNHDAERAAEELANALRQ